MTDIDEAIARAQLAMVDLSPEERHQAIARLRMTRVEAAVQNARRQLGFLSATDYVVAVGRLVAEEHAAHPPSPPDHLDGLRRVEITRRGLA
jgi:hypothetical protein